MSANAPTRNSSVCQKFWNSRCKVNSKKLWLPKTDSHWKRLKSHSWFSIKKNEKVVKSNLPQCQLSTFASADTQVKKDIRTRKIRIYPTKEQKAIFREWIDTSRYVYNRCVKAINDGEKINFHQLRNKYVTAKDNELVDEWEVKTPKDIRAGAIQDLVTNYKSAFTNVKRKNIKHFSMNFKKRKQTFALRIPKSAVKLNNNRHLQLYERYTDPIKLSKDRAIKYLTIGGSLVEHDIRLFVKRGKWYVSIPFTKKINKRKKKRKRCALDPGLISFQTAYSENEMYKFNGLDEIKKQNEKIDKTRSLLSTSEGRTRDHVKRRLRKTYDRYHNLIDDLHYKTISFLTKRYKEILLPTFESQGMLGKIKKVNRWMLDMKHYQFKQRLIAKCSLEKDSSVMLVNEAYTSKTCGVCGKINKIKGRMLDCSKCGARIERDTNGSKNIYIKYTK